MNAPLAAKFSTAGVIIVAAILIATLANDTVIASDKAETEIAEENICINKSTLGGCCSYNGGVLQIELDGVRCVNGTMSQTCERDGDFSEALSGCCSHNEGVNYINHKTGEVFCNNKEQSGSCSVSLGKCSG